MRKPSRKNIKMPEITTVSKSFPEPSKSPSGSGLSHLSNHKRERFKYYLAASISLITFLVYLKSLHNEFVNWDDVKYVIENPYIRSLNGALLKWAFFDFYASNWHPLTWISHALDYAVWGLDPLGHHLTNNIIHAVNTFLVVVLVVKLMEAASSGPTRKGGFETRPYNIIAAGVTGLLFGIHPVHVESVAWVSERKDLLCALFFLLSIMMYTRYLTPPSPSYFKRGWRSRGSYILSLVFFTLALLSKPMAVSLPVVLLILDWYPFERITTFRTFRTAFIEKLPFIALSMGSSILTLLAQRGAMVPVEFITFPERVLVAARSLILYLWKMVLPHDLSPYYPYPHSVSPFSLTYILSIVLITGISTFCLFIAKRQKVWLSLWGYYIVTLVPVLGLVQVGEQSMADRYTYLPGLGLFMMIGLTAAWLLRKPVDLQQRNLIVKLIGIVTSVALVVSMSFLTLKQIGLWKDSFTLWTYVIEKGPEKSYIAYQGRGLVFYQMGQPDKAIEDYSEAISLNPSSFEAYSNRGVAFVQLGKFDKAIEDYSEAVALNPTYHSAYYNRGLVYSRKGRLDKAIGDYSEAIALDPFYYEAYSDRGSAFFQMGRLSEAIEDFDHAIALDQNNPGGFLNRGFVYLKAGQTGQALNDFRKACELGDSIGCNAPQYLLK